MYRIVSTLILLITICSCLIAMGQNIDKGDKIPKRALFYYNESEEFYNIGAYERAIVSLHKAIEIAPDFIQAQMRLGDLYSTLYNFEKALVAYHEVMRIDSNFNKRLYLSSGKAAFNTYLYENAKRYFNKYLTHSGIMYDKKVEAQEYLKNCDYAIEALANPVPFKPINLGENINTYNPEFHPAITADEQILIYTVRLKKGRFWDEDFFISFKENGKWNKARNIGAPINTTESEGALGISPDGKHLYYAGCRERKGYGSCDIYLSKRNGLTWETPVNLGLPVNTKWWESQPSISSDGNELYFVSNRPGGIGGKDIWVSLKLADGHWGIPINLGPRINTIKDEQSPFIHPDGETLYFSSNGQLGMGNADLFISRRGNDGLWLKPMNLGYPINTPKDEISLFVSADGKHAYYASDRFEGKGELDLYHFELYDEIKPLPVTYVKGVVYDHMSKENLGADIELIDLLTGKTVIKTRSDEITGSYLVILRAGRNYALNVSKKKYLFHSENFSLKDRKSTNPYLIDVGMKIIDVGESVILANVFFEHDSYHLKMESRTELGKLTEFLNDYPKVKIEIGGHTDTTGTPSYNQELSENRAKAVQSYLIEHGITKSRLTYKGYGEEVPIATNDTEEGRAMNRRTEFTIMEK